MEYNLALGERRAKEATKHLVELCIDKKKIKMINYGKESPLDQGHNKEVWAKRRDHLSLHTNNKIVIGDNENEKIPFPFFNSVSCIRYGLRNYL